MPVFRVAYALVATCILSVSGAYAQTGQPMLTDPEPVIAVEQNAAASDIPIASRIRNIFTEIDNLSAVDVEVKEGVVTLRGEVANEAAAHRAQRIAIRLAGVVTVQDEIDRTLAVADNLYACCIFWGVPGQEKSTVERHHTKPVSR